MFAERIMKLSSEKISLKYFFEFAENIALKLFYTLTKKI